MKRTALILCIITFAFILCSCKAVKINTADELTGTSWEAVNLNGVSAKLSFDIKSCEADFSVTDTNGEKSAINGVFAIDKNNLYITSSTLCKTYKFGYKVYKDRVILTYNGVDLTFNAVKEIEP